MTKNAERKAPAPLRTTARLGEAESVTLARTALRPSVRAAITVQSYSKQFGELDLTALADELTAQNTAAARGDRARSEAMLLSQAHTLDAIFHELIRRAGLNLGTYLNAAETYMRLGLKAQSQCRATLETLAAIKNPAPVTFVKQANVAHGPQQVNNGPAPAGEPSHARETENQPSKLLEKGNGERLDTGAPRGPVCADSSLEAVGAIDWPENGGGQSTDCPECL
jgi:hypothetical protein